MLIHIQLGISVNLVKAKRYNIPIALETPIFGNYTCMHVQLSTGETPHRCDKLSVCTYLLMQLNSFAWEATAEYIRKLQVYLAFSSGYFIPLHESTCYAKYVNKINCMRVRSESKHASEHLFISLVPFSH